MANPLRALLNAAEQTTRRQFLKGAGGAAGAAALPKVPKAVDPTPSGLPRKRTNVLPRGTKSVFDGGIAGRAPMVDREGNVYLGAVDAVDEDYFMSPQQVNELKKQLTDAQREAAKFDALTREVLGGRGATYDPNTGGFHSQIELAFPDENYSTRVTEKFTPDNVALTPIRHDFYDESGRTSYRPRDSWDWAETDAGETESMMRLQTEDPDDLFDFAVDPQKNLQRNYNKSIAQYKKALQADDAGSLQARKKGKHDHLNRLQDKEKQKRLVSGVRFGSNAPVDDAGDPRRAFNQVNPLGELMDVEGSRSIELPIPKREKPSRFTNPLGLAPFLLQRDDDA
jgi:hypothetical protein